MTTNSLRKVSKTYCDGIVEMSLIYIFFAEWSTILIIFAFIQCEAISAHSVFGERAFNLGHS